MRVLILGGNGMIGHRMWLAAHTDHETWVTIHGRLADQPWAPLFDPSRVIECVTAEDASTIDEALRIARPDVVINAVGVVKQRREAADPGPTFAANSYLPHYVRLRCDAAGARLIHLSTDCVFSGTRGSYRETDPPDVTDVYGLSKVIGEVGAPHLTIRKSAVGRSLYGADGLLEWLLAQRGEVKGFRNAIFTGLATQALAETVLAIVRDHQDLAGIWHVAAEPISKFDLLRRLAQAYGLEVSILPVDEPRIDRSLDDTRFREHTHTPRPTWDALIEAMVEDRTPYARLRGG